MNATTENALHALAEWFETEQDRELMRKSNVNTGRAMAFNSAAYWLNRTINEIKDNENQDSI